MEKIAALQMFAMFKAVVDYCKKNAICTECPFQNAGCDKHYMPHEAYKEERRV